MSEKSRPFSITLLALLYPLASAATLVIFVYQWIQGGFPEVLGPFPTTWSLGNVLWMLAAGHGVWRGRLWGRLLALLGHVAIPVALIVLFWMDRDGIRPLGADIDLGTVALVAVLHFALAWFYLRAAPARAWFGRR